MPRRAAVTVTPTTQETPVPDRIIRSSAGVLGGLLIILGVTYAWLGLTWILTPTQTRLAGIEWAGIAAHYVGLWWLTGAAAILIGGALSRRPVCAGIGTALAVLTPLAVAALFAWSVAEGNARGWITAGSYAPYAVLAAWVAVRSPRVSEAAIGDATTALRAHRGEAHDDAQ